MIVAVVGWTGTTAFAWGDKPGHFHRGSATTVTGVTAFAPTSTTVTTFAPVSTANVLTLSTFSVDRRRVNTAPTFVPTFVQGATRRVEFVPTFIDESPAVEEIRMSSFAPTFRSRVVLESTGPVSSQRILELAVASSKAEMYIAHAEAQVLQAKVAEAQSRALTAETMNRALKDAAIADLKTKQQAIQDEIYRLKK